MLDKNDFEKFKDDSDLFDECLKSGKVGKEQLDIFENFWNTKSGEIDGFDTFTKIAVLHHHVIPIPSEELKPFSILTDAGRFLEILSKCDIDIILHGHEHCPFMAKVGYNLALLGESYEKESLILGAGSAGTERLKYEKEIGNHYSIIRINNWKTQTNPIEIDIEWRYNKEKDFKFISFSGLKPVKLKEKARMADIDQLRLEEARLYKLKEIKYDLKIEENGFWERTTEVNVVSTTRRLKEVEHFLIAVDSPEEFKFIEPEIEHIDGVKVKKVPEIEIKGENCYLYVIAETPLRFNEETRYKYTEKHGFSGFFMSLEDYRKNYSKETDQFFEYYSFQAIRSVELLKLKITFPDGFLQAMANEKQPFVKATMGEEVNSASNTSETKRIKFKMNENSIEMEIRNLEYAINYLLCWYPPEKWLLTQKSIKKS